MRLAATSVRSKARTSSEGANELQEPRWEALGEDISEEWGLVRLRGTCSDCGEGCWNVGECGVYGSVGGLGVVIRGCRGCMVLGGVSCWRVGVIEHIAEQN